MSTTAMPPLLGDALVKSTAGNDHAAALAAVLWNDKEREWKKEQSIGWDTDLNDGGLLNIYPFMTAEILCHHKTPKLDITWDKDRGKDVESAPWFTTFGSEHINDHHLTRAEKLADGEKEA